MFQASSLKLPFLILTFAIFCASTNALATQQLPDPDGKPADMSKKVKVFIIMGQSNTLEMGKVAGEEKEGTLEHATKTASLYPFMVDDSGSWTVRKDIRNIHTQGSGGPDGRGGRGLCRLERPPQGRAGGGPAARFARVRGALGGGLARPRPLRG